MAPAFINEYEARTEYYDGWLKERTGRLPDKIEERLIFLVAKRMEDYQKLCDLVYEKKGYTSAGIPRRETVEKFGLLDEKAKHLLDEYEA